MYVELSCTLDSYISIKLIVAVIWKKSIVPKLKPHFTYENNVIRIWSYIAYVYRALNDIY